MIKTTYLQKKIIKQLYFQKSLSCAELSSLINKSLPVTTRLINDFLQTNILIENGFAQSTGGRRPVTYSLKSDLFYIVSVAMDQFVTRIAMLNTWNEVVFSHEVIELPLKDNQNALSVLINSIKDLVSESKIQKDNILGIGIGMPGFINTSKGMNFSFLPTNGVSIVEIMQSELNVPVFIDNDSSLIALAESKFGLARGLNNVMVVNIGWGIGLGMLLDGKLFRGENGLAGEFSHIPLFTNNKLCSCGKTGCLETETSLLVLADKAVEELKAGRSSMLGQSKLANKEQIVDAIFDVAAKGDKFAIELISKISYNIGKGASILIHLLNPSVILLSGRGSKAGNFLLAPIQQAINENSIPKISENTKIKVSNLGHSAELIGAAALVMDNYDMFEPLTKIKEMSVLTD